VQDALKEINTKDTKIAAAERKARQQRALDETVRGEREVVSTKVMEVQAEIEQLKHAFDCTKSQLSSRRTISDGRIKNASLTCATSTQCNTGPRAGDAGRSMTRRNAYNGLASERTSPLA
jgi:hypothetical protein